MKYALLALIFTCYSASILQADDSAWSEIDNGLRGRLSVLPSLKKGSPFYRVFIELQNTDDAIGQRKIRFDLEKLSFSITRDGKEVPKPGLAGSYDGMKPLWEPLLLPYQGTIKFQISFPGRGYSPQQKGIIDLDYNKCWVIPQDGSPSFLSGALTIQRDMAEHPLMDWYGTIKFPPVEIPKQK